MDLGQIYTLLSIATLIVLGASINHVNLLNALGNRRAKEIAIRKTLGASNLNVFFQLIIESLLYVLFGCFLAMILAYALVNPVATFLNRSIDFNIFTDNLLVAGILLLVAVTTVLSGIYPSSVMSRYSARPIFVAGSQHRGTGKLRLVLNTVQFSILTGLVIFTITVFNQVQFGIRESSAPSGDTIININSSCDETLKQALLELNNVIGVSCSALLPQLGMNYDTSISKVGSTDENVRILYTALDADFFDLYGIDIIAGRSFDESRVSDFSPRTNQWDAPEAIVINETATSQLGFETPEAAIGSVLEWARFYNPTSLTPAHDAIVIGVINDFQIGPVSDGLRPAAFVADPRWTRQVSVKINASSVQETLVQIDALWREREASGPIIRNFYDSSVETMYQSTLRQAQLSAAYAGVAMSISLLGLIGLSVFESQKRTKEIGIRKVLGGSRGNIITMLVWDFAKPVFLSIFISWPITYYILNQWFQNYQRHIELGPWVFILSSAAIAGTSLILVSFYTFRSASVNPVSAIRYQ